MVWRTGLLTPLLLLAILAGLLCGFYWETLVEARTQIHGDGLIHGLALLDFHYRAIHEGFSLLWTDKAYGGHPIFAEGQGAFANPLNLLMALFVPPVEAHVLYHMLCMGLSAVGVFGLARTLGLGPWPAAYAGIGFAFSTLSILTNGNMTVSGALMWMPFTVWAMEAWLQKPSWRRAAVFGLVVACSVFAGYPQLMHGTVMFMVLSLLVLPAQRSLWLQLYPAIGQWLKTGLFAVLLCAALAAVQWLPLLELVGYSHRNEGVDYSSFPVEIFYRGMLYNLPVSEHPVNHFPVIGSLLVCVLASLVLLVKLPLRFYGYLLSAFIMLQLSFGSESWLFRFAYNNGLIPGIEYFRIMFIYQYQVVLTILLAGAFVLDGLAKQRWQPQRWWLVAAVVLVPFWALAVYLLHDPRVPPLHYWVLAAALLAMLVLQRNNWRRCLPAAVALLAFFEISQLKLNSYYFGSEDIVSKPESLITLQQHTDMALYKVHDPTLTVTYGFWNPQNPDNGPAARRVVLSFTSSTNLLWDLPSYDGAFALPLLRQRLILSRINDEGYGDVGTAPGLRFIDFLSIRYITAMSESTAPALKTAYHDTDKQVLILENTAALPKYQAYTRAQYVDTPEQAMLAVQGLTEAQLVVERLPGVAMPPLLSQPNKANAMQWQVLQQNPDAYRFAIQASEPGWFFISDANYPGWQATLNGQSVPVHYAQVMGKAVYIPAGEHQLELRFVSASFRWGLGISLLGAVLLLLALWRGAASPVRLLANPPPQHD